jgi:spore germination protein KA
MCVSYGVDTLVTAHPGMRGWQKVFGRHKIPSPLPRKAAAARLLIEQAFAPCPDLRAQSLVLDGRGAELLWLDGMVDKDLLQTGISIAAAPWTPSAPPQADMGTPAVAVTTLSTIEDCQMALLDGKAVLFVDGTVQAFAWDIQKTPGRSVDRPEKEPTLEGPQEAFVESIQINIALLRKRLRTEKLKLEMREIGESAKTQVALCYVDGIVKPELVEEARQRLSRIRVDTVHGINALKEFIEDIPFTLFPTTEETERPDRVAAALMQGRICIMANGTPNGMLVPATFVGFLSASEDYHLHWALAMPLRFMRHIMFWLSILLPALYVSALTYNQDLMQTPLLVSVAAQHLGIPWPTVFEALVMMGAFEALREAGTRLPRPVGASVSIVGTLIIGDAAVRAGLISAGMVIVIALTGVASFTMPSTTLVQTVRILQFSFVFAASFFGVVGIVLLGIVMVGHMASLRSFGVPYLSPMAPLMVSDLKDVIFRAPWWMMWKRPREYEPVNEVRSKSRRLQPRREKES